MDFFQDQETRKLYLDLTNYQYHQKRQRDRSSSADSAIPEPNQPKIQNTGEAFSLRDAIKRITKDVPFSSWKVVMCGMLGAPPGTLSPSKEAVETVLNVSTEASLPGALMAVFGSQGRDRQNSPPPPTPVQTPAVLSDLCLSSEDNASDIEELPQSDEDSSYSDSDKEDPLVVSFNVFHHLRF